MRKDPMPSVVRFLRNHLDLPSRNVTGDMNSRQVGELTVYVEHNGGFRMTRDCMDRVDVIYEVYGSDREEVADMAFLVSEHFLERLPDTLVGDHYFLDSSEIDMPDYDPDAASREHVYCGEVALFYVAA